MKITIGMADDHQLFVKSLGALINTFQRLQVILDAGSGSDLLKKLEASSIRPDIIILDVSMPMDGIATAKVLTEKYPLIKLTALSQKEDDLTIINMIRAGCCAYLQKDIHEAELEKALIEIYEKGYYNADSYNVHYRRREEKEKAFNITERERQFLQLSCSDLTYRQIAAQMHLSERTIDGYRESVFAKFNVQSRTGMALEAIKRNLVAIN